VTCLVELLTDIRWQIALAIFFPFYVLAEIPSNMMMKRTRPALWIPFIMVLWGITTTLLGVVKNYHGLLAARAALGLAEGGLFPGVTFCKYPLRSVHSSRLTSLV
jgi:hypothetical protein